MPRRASSGHANRHYWRLPYRAGGRNIVSELVFLESAPGNAVEFPRQSLRPFWLAPPPFPPRMNSKIIFARDRLLFPAAPHSAFGALRAATQTLSPTLNKDECDISIYGVDSFEADHLFECALVLEPNKHNAGRDSQ
jgi:hypothetical protein